MTATESAHIGTRLGIAVGPDAMVCIDLVLDDVGVDYHHLRRTGGGAHVTIDLEDRADGYRIVDALRQHLGAELREATIFHGGEGTRVVWNAAEPKTDGCSNRPRPGQESPVSPMLTLGTGSSEHDPPDLDEGMII
jgi:hypothetical protein